MKRGFPRHDLLSLRKRRQKPTLRLREPIVVKADGLAAGKGVTVAATVEEAFGAIEAIFQGQFGSAGKFVLEEECLTGQKFWFWL